MARYRQFSTAKEKFPWLLFLAFVASILIFWGLPYLSGTPPLKVEFGNANP